MIFNERLKSLCSDAGLQQKEFAAKVNMKQARISYYFRGAGEPSYDLLVQFADFFGVSVDYILGHDIEETKQDKILEDMRIENLRLKKENETLKNRLNQINQISEI